MNFHDVCRTCLTTENLHPIFVGQANDSVNLNPIYMGSVNDKRYSAAVFATTGIKVGTNDGLPQHMCTRCVSFTNASLKFRKQCKDAETRLLQLQIECDGAAEILNSRAGGEDSNKDKRLELKDETDEDNGVQDSDAASTSEADIPLISVTDVLNTTEEDPLQLKPAGASRAAPPRSPARPGERPLYSTSPQKLQLRSCFVRLERFPIQDLQRTCKTCLITFDCASGFRNHRCTNLVKESTSNEVCDGTAKKHFKCDICGKEFSEKRHVIRHLAAHNVKQVEGKMSPYSSEDAKLVSSADKSYSDKVSKTKFRNQSVLTIATEERIGPYICDMCSKEFPQKQLLIRHIRKQHRVVVANKTHKQFARKTHLTRHITTHTGEKLYGCDLCKKAFTQKSHLQAHMRIHTGEKPFACDVCEKRFTQSNNLTRHRRIHTGNKPSSCSVCKKQFRNQSVLTIATGERIGPYICDMCSKEFPQKQLLIRHIRKQHRVIFANKTHKHICDICKTRCRSLSKLAAHMRVHTKEKLFSCDVCNKQFTQKGNVNKHKLIHTGATPYRCSVCNKQFNQKSTLASHMLTHTGMKLYSCEICHKQFARMRNLIRHSIIHTGQKPFSCDFCEQKFALKQGLVNHWMRMHSGTR